MNEQPQSGWTSSKPPVGHPDYEFPKEVHNLLVSAQSGHIQLSAMADTKASILMGATFVVFTLALGAITSDSATIPLLLLGVFSFLASVMSVLAIRPRITASAKPDPNANPLFFGVFTSIPEEQFVDQLIDVLRSEETTYRAMAKDLYQNGQVLQQRKYKYLAYAYTLFLIGLVLTFVAFMVDFATR